MNYFLFAAFAICFSQHVAFLTILTWNKQNTTQQNAPFDSVPLCFESKQLFQGSPVITKIHLRKYEKLSKSQQTMLVGTLSILALWACRKII